MLISSEACRQGRWYIAIAYMFEKLHISKELYSHAHSLICKRNGLEKNFNNNKRYENMQKEYYINGMEKKLEEKMWK